jgi:hypothetical protein
MQQVEIHLKGQLDCHWSEWFEGLQLTHTEAGQTQLRGTVPDQAALFGLMAKLRNLGLTVASLTIVEVETANEIATELEKGG